MPSELAPGATAALSAALATEPAAQRHEVGPLVERDRPAGAAQPVSGQDEVVLTTESALLGVLGDFDLPHVDEEAAQPHAVLRRCGLALDRCHVDEVRVAVDADIRPDIPQLGCDERGARTTALLRP